jgi:tRNA pseudouridine13 synthase
VLSVSRHGNKLRPGHLRGNRFRILIRNPVLAAPAGLETLLNRFRQEGLPNFYGPQRFGREGETVRLGLSLLRPEPAQDLNSGRQPNLRNPFLRKLALSAVQSALFNQYLARRLEDGLLRRVLRGDVMAKWPMGGLFVVEDVVREQGRFDIRETVSTGPIFGRKTFAAAGDAAEREETVLQEAGLTRASFGGFGKLMQGTRRHNVVYLEGLKATIQAQGVLLAFTLPAGSYASILLREVMKVDLGGEDEQDQGRTQRS